MKRQSIKCPNCGIWATFYRTIDTQKFKYGPESNSVTLKVEVYVDWCSNCGFGMTDGYQETARDAAVLRHLKRIP